MSNTYAAKQQASAAAAILSGERSFRNVQFATTGDAEADAISGILQVLDACGVRDFKCQQRVLEYLRKRAEHCQELADKDAERHAIKFPQQQYGLGSQAQPLGNVYPASAGIIGPTGQCELPDSFFRSIGLQSDPPDVP